jgi:hypothetical protein
MVSELRVVPKIEMVITVHKSIHLYISPKALPYFFLRNVSSSYPGVPHA